MFYDQYCYPFTNRVANAAHPLIVFLAFLFFLPGCRNTEHQPNILFILVDDLGPEWISAYGSDVVETPNVDRLAEYGMLFTSAYSMPQCTPTRVTLLTGQYPFRHGWTNHWDVPRWGAGAHFDPDLNPSFARILRATGYKTAIAGKWQINDFRVQPDVLEEHGFDEWAVWTGYETGNPPSAERYWDPYIHIRDGSQTYEGRFGTDVFVDFLIDFMKEYRDEPMLLYFPMALTHPPLIPTPSEPDATGMIPRHRAMVRYMDHAVGRLVTALEELDLRDKTIIFFTTDNGTSRGIVGRMNGRNIEGGKGTLGENGMLAPFIVNSPGIVPAGVRTGALTDFTDLLPTFVDLAGTTIPDTEIVDGHSIVPLLRGQTENSPREWIMAMGFGPARLTPEGVTPVQTFTDRVVRDKRYKLWILDGEPARLYDLFVDPGEQENILGSTDPSVIEARRKLEAVVRTFPSKDARPRYNPNPPQPWDRLPE